MVRVRSQQVVFDTTDPRASAEFWRQLLGLCYREGHERPPQGEEEPVEWLNLYTSEGERALAFQYVEELAPSTWPGGDVPQQLHLDLVVDDVEELLDAEALVVALGGRVLDDRSDDDEEPLIVFADPSGHPFCVLVGEE